MEARISVRPPDRRPAASPAATEETPSVGFPSVLLAASRNVVADVSVSSSSEAATRVAHEPRAAAAPKPFAPLGQLPRQPTGQPAATPRPSMPATTPPTPGEGSATATAGEASSSAPLAEAPLATNGANEAHEAPAQPADADAADSTAPRDLRETAAKVAAQEPQTSASRPQATVSRAPAATPGSSVAAAPEASVEISPRESVPRAAQSPRDADAAARLLASESESHANDAVESRFPHERAPRPSSNMSSSVERAPAESSTDGSLRESSPRTSLAPASGDAARSAAAADAARSAAAVAVGTLPEGSTVTRAERATTEEVVVEDATDDGPRPPISSAGPRQASDKPDAAVPARAPAVASLLRLPLDTAPPAHDEQPAPANASSASPATSTSKRADAEEADAKTTASRSASTSETLPAAAPERAASPTRLGVAPTAAASAPTTQRAVDMALRVLPGFEAQLAVRARELLDRGTTEIRIMLDPPSLGRLRVRLLLTSTEAVARISAGSTEAAALLQRERSELVRAFEQQGFSRVEVHVDAEGGRPFEDRSDDTSRNGEHSVDAAETEHGVRLEPRRAGRVDLFV